MSLIDKMRIAAMSRQLGCTFSIAHGWTVSTSIGYSSRMAERDAMHRCTQRRADALKGCTEGSPQKVELKAIVEAIEAYDVKRGPVTALDWRLVEPGHAP